MHGMGRQAVSVLCSCDVIFCFKSSIRAVVFPRSLTQECSHHKVIAGHLNYTLKKETKGTLGQVGCSSYHSYQVAVQDRHITIFLRICQDSLLKRIGYNVNLKLDFHSSSSLPVNMQLLQLMPLEPGLPLVMGNHIVKKWNRIRRVNILFCFV